MEMIVTEDLWQGWQDIMKQEADSFYRSAMDIMKEWRKRHPGFRAKTVDAGIARKLNKKKVAVP